MPKEMKLIVEEGYPSELKEANSLFLGGFLNNLKHGKGKFYYLQIRHFSQE